MSREVRRVPIGWQHPTRPDPIATDPVLLAFRASHTRPPSRLHAPGVCFVGLMDNYPRALQEWTDGKANYEQRTGKDWTWAVDYHLTGYHDPTGTWCPPQPLLEWDADGQDILRKWAPANEDELARDHPWEDEYGDQPDPAQYLPVFTEADGELGWVLYETVSDGTPTTPVLPTEQALIDWLVTYGEDYDQIPYRPEAAQRLVGAGCSLGSIFQPTGGPVLSGSRDLDLIAGQA